MYFLTQIIPTAVFTLVFITIKERYLNDLSRRRRRFSQVSVPTSSPRANQVCPALSGLCLRNVIECVNFSVYFISTTINFHYNTSRYLPNFSMTNTKKPTFKNFRRSLLESYSYEIKIVRIP